MYGISKCFGNWKEHITKNKKLLDLDNLDLFEDTSPISLKETKKITDSGLPLTPKGANDTISSYLSVMKRKRKSFGWREAAKRSSKVISVIDLSLRESTNSSKPCQLTPVLSLSPPRLIIDDVSPYPTQPLHVNAKRTSGLYSILTANMSAREKMMTFSGQVEVVRFEEFARTIEIVKKLNEGSFAEVFITKSGSIVKIMPFGGDTYNGVPQKTAKEVLPEIVINKKLSDLRESECNRTDGFVQLIKSLVVSGPFPRSLVELWRAFDQENESYNDDPEMFDEDQLFMILELTNGGVSLESYEFESYQQQYDVMTQLGFSLAIGESAYEFEHRDLHIGNVLISPCLNEVVKWNGKSAQLGAHSVKTTIIDYTLSRITCDGVAMFSDLKEETDIFEGSDTIQFDVYRRMRDINGNDWGPFQPKSNLLWLQYVGKMLLSEFEIDNEMCADSLYYKTKLVDMVDNMLDYSSVLEWVENYF